MSKKSIHTNLVGKHARLRKDIVDPDGRELSGTTFEIVAAYLDGDLEVTLTALRPDDGRMHTTYPNMIEVLPNAEQPRSRR